METRTKHFIRTRIFDTRASSRPGPRDPTIHYIRHSQPKSTRKMNPPRYKIIEPKKPTRSRVPSGISIRTLSPIRSRPVRFRLPFLSRAVKPEQDSDSESEPEWESNSDTDSSSSSGEGHIRRPRCRNRSRDRFRRLFVVNDPNDMRWPQRRTLRSPSPETRSPQPRRKVFIGPDNETGGLDVSTRCPRLRQLSGGPRRPRERTPVSERGSPRRGPRVVEIHNNDHCASPRRERGRSPARRQVRFASDVGFEKNANRARENKSRERKRYHVRSPHRHTSDLSSDYGTANSGATCRLRSPKRTNTERWRKTRMFGERARPRIIYDGIDQMSEAAEHIRKGWRRHSRESLLRDLKSHSDRSRCVRRCDERIIYGRGHRQYDRRWPCIGLV